MPSALYMLQLKTIIVPEPPFWSDVKMSGYATQWNNFDLNDRSAFLF